MEHGIDNSLLVHRALSMAGASGTEVSPEGAEVAKLVRLALGGDATAFEQIIARYERRVMTVAIRLLGTRDDAQDAAQEVFYRAFKYLHRLDPQKPVEPDRKSTRLNSSHSQISYAVFCLKKKNGS